MPYCPSCNGRFQEGTFCPKDGTALLPDGETTKSLVLDRNVAPSDESS